MTKDKLKYYWYLFRNFWMNYDTKKKKKRVVNITYYKKSYALTIKFKDGTGAILTLGDQFNVKDEALPDDVLKAMGEAMENGHSKTKIDKKTFK